MRAIHAGIILTVAVLVAPAVGRTAEETLAAHEHAASTTIVLDTDKIQPSAVTADRHNVLVFENHSVHPMTLRFVEPDDAAEKIHCHFVRHGAGEKPEAPWELFGLQGGKLVATIPPGKVASVCSFDPGTYAFVAEPLRAKTGGGEGQGGGVLSEKGQITIQ
jgi:hypothetical protein